MAEQNSTSVRNAHTGNAAWGLTAVLVLLGMYEWMMLFKAAHHMVCFLRTQKINYYRHLFRCTPYPHTNDNENTVTKYQQETIICKETEFQKHQYQK